MDKGWLCLLLLTILLLDALQFGAVVIHEGFYHQDFWGLWSAAHFLLLLWALKYLGYWPGADTMDGAFRHPVWRGAVARAGGCALARLR